MSFAAPSPSAVDSMIAAALLAISRADSSSEADVSPEQSVAQPSAKRTKISVETTISSLSSVDPKPRLSPQRPVEKPSSWIQVAPPECSLLVDPLSVQPSAPLGHMSPEKQRVFINSITSPVPPRTTTATDIELFRNSLYFGGLSEQELCIQRSLQSVADVTSYNNASLLRLIAGSNASSNDLHEMMMSTTAMTPEQSTAAAPLKTSTLAPFSSLARGVGNNKHARDAFHRSANNECPVRRQEIEKALQSKPQRGRKRANLSQVERHELTRNRNREHAKSTRLRKKARYQELLDCEQKLKELLEKDELEEKRRQCVVGFVAVRERMLQDIANSGCSSEDNHKTTQQLEALVEEISTLSYQDSTSHDDLSAVDRMKQFDRTFASCALRTFGSNLLLSYNMNRSLDDIATSPGGSSLTEIDIVGPGNMRLLSALLKIQFAPNSAKIRTIAFTAIRESCERGGFDRLDDQVSHPSAVSLDLDKDRPDIDDCNETKAESDHGLDLE